MAQKGQVMLRKSLSSTWYVSIKTEEEELSLHNQKSECA